jgi:hypothetical protein
MAWPGRSYYNWDSQWCEIQWLLWSLTLSTTKKTSYNDVQQRWNLNGNSHREQSMQILCLAIQINRVFWKRSTTRKCMLNWQQLNI